MFNPLCSHLSLHSQLKAKDPVKDTKGILRDGESHTDLGCKQETIEIRGIFLVSLASENSTLPKEATMQDPVGA